MRITQTTPSFDPLTPPWDQQRHFPDGLFMDCDGISLSCLRYRITYCLRSAVPRTYVLAAGRCLNPQGRLFFRIGAEPATYLSLNRETTLYIAADDMKVTVTKMVMSQEEFMKEWRDIIRGLDQKYFEVKEGMFSVLEK